MSDLLLKTGSMSIILGKGHYKDFIEPKKNKLLKVTKRIPRHDEFRLLNIVREIENYEDYYSIPEETAYILNPSDKFYKYLKEITKAHRMTIFNEYLECYYINFAGGVDLLDTISYMIDNHKSNIWRNNTDIMEFANSIMKGLKYLHEKKICHLDIKPENIVVDLSNRKFKIIDFGFASLEPFYDFIANPNGTPGYFPKQFAFDPPTPWLPKIEATDTIKINGMVPMKGDPRLVYKIDSYSFGRVLNFLAHIFENDIEPTCWVCSQSKNDIINKIITDLLENDVRKRITITECYDKYFV